MDCNSNSATPTTATSSSSSSSSNQPHPCGTHHAVAPAATGILAHLRKSLAAALGRNKSCHSCPYPAPVDLEIKAARDVVLSAHALPFFAQSPQFAAKAAKPSKKSKPYTINLTSYGVTVAEILVGCAYGCTTSSEFAACLARPPPHFTHLAQRMRPQCTVAGKDDSTSALQAADAPTPCPFLLDHFATVYAAAGDLHLTNVCSHLIHLAAAEVTLSSFIGWWHAAVSSKSQGLQEIVLHFALCNAAELAPPRLAQADAAVDTPSPHVAAIPADLISAVLGFAGPRCTSPDTRIPLLRLVTAWARRHPSKTGEAISYLAALAQLWLTGHSAEAMPHEQLTSSWWEECLSAFLAGSCSAPSSPALPPTALLVQSLLNSLRADKGPTSAPRLKSKPSTKEKQRENKHNKNTSPAPGQPPTSRPASTSTPLPLSIRKEHEGRRLSSGRAKTASVPATTASYAMPTMSSTAKLGKSHSKSRTSPEKDPPVRKSSMKRKKSTAAPTATTGSGKNELRVSQEKKKEKEECHTASVAVQVELLHGADVCKSVSTCTTACQTRDFVSDRAPTSEPSALRRTPSRRRLPSRPQAAQRTTPVSPLQQQQQQPGPQKPAPAPHSPQQHTAGKGQTSHNLLPLQRPLVPLNLTIVKLCTSATQTSSEESVDAHAVAAKEPVLYKYIASVDPLFAHAMPPVSPPSAYCSRNTTPPPSRFRGNELPSFTSGVEVVKDSLADTGVPLQRHTGRRGTFRDSALSINSLSSSTGSLTSPSPPSTATHIEESFHRGSRCDHAVEPQPLEDASNAVCGANDPAPRDALIPPPTPAQFVQPLAVSSEPLAPLVTVADRAGKPEQQELLQNDKDGAFHLLVIGGKGISGLEHSVQALHAPTGAWVSLADTIMPRVHAAVAVAGGGNVYLFGGEYAYGSGEWLDVGQNVWRTLTPSTACMEGCTATLMRDDVIFLCGGYDPPKDNASAATTAFDPVTQTWCPLAAMPTKRMHHAACAVGTYLAVAGGQTTSGELLASVETYHPGEDRWYALPSLATPRKNHGMVAHNKTIFVIGGVDEKDQPLQSVEVYTLGSDGWLAGPPLPHARHSASASLHCNAIYVIGGIAPECPMHEADAPLSLSLQTMVWESVTIPASHLPSNKCEQQGQILLNSTTPDTCSFAGPLLSVSGSRRRQSAHQQHQQQQQSQQPSSAPEHDRRKRRQRRASFCSTLGVRSGLCAAILPAHVISIPPPPTSFMAALNDFEAVHGVVAMPSGAKTVHHVIRCGGRAGVTRDAITSHALLQGIQHRIRDVLMWLQDQGLVYKTVHGSYRSTVPVQRRHSMPPPSQHEQGPRDLLSPLPASPTKAVSPSSAAQQPLVT